jgi:multidrug resistance efflux pump
MKKIIFRLVLLLIVAAAGYGGYRFFKKGPDRGADIATTTVLRGDVVIQAFTRGELKPVRTFSLYSPQLNGTIQVTQLAPMGALAREKDLIVEYDDSELLASIESDKLSLDTVDENILSQRLTMRIQQSSDKVDLLSAQFAVKKAELNVQKNDVVDEITARKYLLALEQAKRALAQQLAEIDNRKVQQDSQLTVYNQNRTRSLQELQRDQLRLQQTKTLSPMEGLIAVKQNRTGNFNFGQQMPDIRTGDQLTAGMNVADILDLSEMEMTAKVGELDRANLQEGQLVSIQLDSIPDKRFPGKIKMLSGTATTDVFSGDPSKKFDLTFTVDMRALLSGIGVKPAEVDRIMKMADQNRARNLVSFAPATGGGGRGGGEGGRGGGPGGGGGFGGPGGFPGGPGGFPGGGLDAGMPVVRLGDAGAGAQAAQTGRGGDESGRGGQDAQSGGRRGGFTTNLSEEDQKKLADLRQKLAAASTDEERQKLRDEMQKILPAMAGRGQRGQRADAGAQGGRGDSAAQGRGGDTAAAGRSGRGGAGAQGAAQASPSRGTTPTYTDEERAKAKLPAPPEEDSAVSVLLRPGLLADVQIEVEKIPNAIHIPASAVFRKEGKLTVFVKQANGKFQARQVELGKQSESAIVITSGLKEGEIVALSDPTANKKQGNTEEKKASSSSAMPMPGGN